MFVTQTASPFCFYILTSSHAIVETGERVLVTQDYTTVHSQRQCTRMHVQTHMYVPATDASTAIGKPVGDLGDKGDFVCKQVREGEKMEGWRGVGRGGEVLRRGQDSLTLNITALTKVK